MITKEEKSRNFCNKHCVGLREKCFISKMNKEMNAETNRQNVLGVLAFEQSNK